MPPSITMRDGDGNAHTIAADDVAYARGLGWKVETDDQGFNRTAAEAEADAYSGLGDTIDAYAGGVARGVTAGGSDVVLRGLGDSTARNARKQQVAHPYASTAGEVVGNIAATATGVGPLGKAAALGAKVGTAAEGAGALTRIARAGAGAAIEGGAIGFGSGVSELALAEDPPSVERAISTLSSKALYGAAIGGVAGSLAKGAEIGLVKAKGAIDEAAATWAKRADVGDDLARMDAKGLKAAEVAERDAIEATRVTQRAELADEITAFRRELKTQKHAITTKDVKLPAVGEKLSTAEIGRISLKANRQLDNILDNPTGLMKNPAKALDALQRQENALSKLVERADDLRQVFAADTTGARAAALDTIAPALERNRALQQKLAAIGEAAASPRLEAIAAAREALTTGGGKSLAEQMAGSTVFGAVTGAVAALPIPGTSLIAPLLGAKASQMVTGKVFGRLGAAMAEGQARSLAAVGKVFGAAARGAKAAPPLATKVLAAVAFAPAREAAAAPLATAARRRLPELYTQRAAELREQVATGPAGKPVVRPATRQRIAAALAPIATMQPLLADRMETLAVRRLEFLADKLPRRPEIGGIQIGPDRWEPSDMQMRAWARYVAAVEDPDGVIERVADGSVTPEDAEVMREVYPEQLADVTRQVLERLPTLRGTLPYNRRLALSVLTGVPVDPSMDPRILAALQAQFEAEPEPPKASPQFGSVKNTEVGTASQRREQGA